MKKTFTINISGIIFHIDEDAYEKLNNYLNILKSHFSKTVGKDEIIADIEGRIAELLQEMLKEQKQVVTIEDINAIIKILGQPSDFIEEEAQAEAEETYDHRGAKRLYRDPDNQIIGGVCSGIAAYFGVNALWVRLLFIILVIAFISPIIYLVLWAVIPKAGTTTEKLEMKGERVNVSTIEKSIKEELHHIKEQFSELPGISGDALKKKGRSTATAAESIAHLLLSVIKVFFQVLIIIAGVALLIIGLGALASFMISFFGWGGFIFADNHELITFPFPSLLDLVSNDIEAAGLLRVGLLMFFGVPIIMLIYAALRMIFRFEGIKQIGFIAFNIWIIGLIIATFFVFRVARNFKHDVTVDRTVELHQPFADTLQVSISQAQYDAVYKEYGNHMTMNEPNLVITEEGKILSYIRLRFRQSPDEQFHLVKHIYARGRTELDAGESTDQAVHQIMQTDTSLVLDPFFTIREGEPWRAHQVNYELQVPLNKAIRLYGNFDDIIRYQSYLGSFKFPGKVLIMTEDGLKEKRSMPDEKETSMKETSRNTAKKTTLTFIVLSNMMSI